VDVQQPGVSPFANPKGYSVRQPNRDGTTQVSLVDFCLSRDLGKGVASVAKVKGSDSAFLFRAHDLSDLLPGHCNAPDYLYQAAEQITFGHVAILLRNDRVGNESLPDRLPGLPLL